MVPIRWTGSCSPQALQVCSDRVGRRKLSWWTELNSGPGSVADLGEWPLFPGRLWLLLCQRRLTPDFLCRRYVWDPLESNSEGKQDVVWKTRGEEEWCGAFLFLYFSTTRHLAFFSAALRSHWADSQSQTPPLFPSRCWTRGWINWVMDKVSKGVRSLNTALGRRRGTRKNLRGVSCPSWAGLHSQKTDGEGNSFFPIHGFPPLLSRTPQTPLSQRRCREEGPFSWLVATQQLYLFWPWSSQNKQTHM